MTDTAARCPSPHSPTPLPTPGPRLSAYTVCTICRATRHTSTSSHDCTALSSISQEVCCSNHLNPRGSDPDIFLLKSLLQHFFIGTEEFPVRREVFSIHAHSKQCVFVKCALIHLPSTHQHGIRAGRTELCYQFLVGLQELLLLKRAAIIIVK